MSCWLWWCGVLLRCAPSLPLVCLRFDLCVSDNILFSPTIFDYLLLFWHKPIFKLFYQTYLSASSLVEWIGERKSALSKMSFSSLGRELAQMNNLYWILGIVCQGDDGQPVSKPKQTDCENRHSLSGEVGEVIGSSETCLILIAGLEGMIQQWYTLNFEVCVDTF